MRLSLRTLVMWFLMLAVPLQGMAAATMAFCGPSHGMVMTQALAQLQAEHSDDPHVGQGEGHVAADLATGTHHPDHGHHHDHGGDDGITDHHQPAHADDAAASDSPPMASTSTSAHGGPIQADDHKCSACASCHSAAAIVTSLPAMPAFDSAATVFAAVVLSVAPFAADGLERPPRPLAA